MSAFTYGWGSEEVHDTFWLRFDSCTRQPKDWKEEVYAASRSIASKAKKPIWICSSGGYDSEIACQAFFDQKIPFSVLTLAHEGGSNQHDIKFAIQWCEKHQVTQKIIDIDMAAFLTSEIDAYAKQYAAIHPFRYLQIKLMELVEEMGGYAVLCSGEQLYKAVDKKPSLSRADLSLTLSNGNIIPLEWCKNNKTEHEPYFYFSTPELCLSYMQLPLVKFALDNPDTVFRHPLNVYTFKRVVYQSIWTDLEIRYKLHGLEQVQVLYLETISRLQKQFASEYIKYDLPLTAFEAQLTESL